ncbi:MAG: GNAT family N-acetyltransferase [Candidatus Bathyarchaeia archaeon]
MTTIRKADQNDVRVLSKKLLALLENKNSQVYRDNVAKFGIPEDYAKRAFAEETLLNALVEGKATFYLALENNEIIGFAQTIQHDANTAELDRIIILPEYTKKGLGTHLLNQVITDQKQKGISNIIANAGKEENQARRFYEKNGFKPIKETTITTPWGKKLTLVTYLLCLIRI